MAVACAIGALVLCVAHAIERDNRREAAWFAWSMCVGLGTLAAMAFSPTVHGSGARTGFVACVALLVGTCRMLAMVRAVDALAIGRDVQDGFGHADDLAAEVAQRQRLRGEDAAIGPALAARVAAVQHRGELAGRDEIRELARLGADRPRAVGAADEDAQVAAQLEGAIALGLDAERTVDIGAVSAKLTGRNARR